MTATRATVLYGHDADAFGIAHAADIALEGSGCFVRYEPSDASVWIWRRNQPQTGAVQFEPGQQLIVTCDGSWQIEAAASPTAVTP